MKKLLLSLITILLIVPFAKADEGLWLPLLVKNQKYAQMRKMGLKLSAEEIYSVNQACVKDAVIGLMSEGANLRSYGTASFISDKGLIITNYHVVMSYIEKFSTPENDFIKYGYWARNTSEESYCRGLEIKQLIRIEDVTDKILEGTEGLKGSEKINKINENGKKIAKEATKGTKYEVRMQSLFGNNQYIMNVYAVYKDIRMVAAPPFALGKFGGNTDNYSWPRHTADFAILRVYAGEDNQPKNYSKSNVFYKPTKSFEISTAGVKEGDFAMIIGYPGTTRQYIPSFALDKIINGEGAARIDLIEAKMNILKQAIAENPEMKFRYTTRLSSVGNSYLRLKGQMQGVRRMDLVNKKIEEEKKFNEWVNSSPELKEEYGTLLKDMEELYKEVSMYNMADLYFNEAGITGSEIVPFIGKFEKLVSIYARKKFDQKSAEGECNRLIGLTDQFFANWGYEVDRKMFRNLMFKYYQNLPDRFKPKAMVKYITEYNGDIEKLSQEVFSKSIFTKKEALKAFLTDSTRNVDSVIKNDALYQLAIGYYMINVERIANQRAQLQAKQMELFEKYMEGLIKMNAGKIMYPDANNSQRISYGKVTGAVAEDGLVYTSTTTADGMFEKYLNNISDEEFYLPKKMQELVKKRDFGKYADKNGNLVINFLNNCHTSSGNSGSPVINAKGELIGLNFDRIWQGLASDYKFEPEKSRSIAVDVRFILFIIDKYSPSSYIMQELKLK